MLVLGIGLLATLLAVVVWCDSAGAASSPSVASRSYADVDYESLQRGTPDIERVTVSRSAGGLVTFRLMFAKPVRVTSDFGSEVFINADRSTATGDEDGWDYTLDYSRPAAGEPPNLSMLVDANGREYEVTSTKARSLRFDASARSVTFRIAAHDLGSRLADRLRKGHTSPSLPELGASFDLDAVTSADWLNDAAGADRLDVRTFPGERATGTSFHEESMVLLWLLVGLIVLVVGQVMARVLGPVPPSAPDMDGRRWDLGVFGAAGAGLGGMLASVLVLLPVGLVETFVFHVHGGPPDAFWWPWLATWSLVPCVVLGYLSGRWWSFVGAAPLLVLWPLGTALASGPSDWFLTLPVTAAVAVALSLGSALRSAWRRGRPARHHHLLPT